MKAPFIIKLKNGIKVILYNSPELITNSILALVKTGTDYENKNNNGISHFVEHLFFKGSKNFPSYEILGLELDKLGAEYNAFTSYEYTGYYIKTLPEYFEKAIYILSDLLINPLFPEEEIEKERKVILEEINFHKDNPFSYLFDETLKIAYGDQPAGWLIIGTEKNIKKLGFREIKKYFDEHYSAKNTVIIVAGDFNPKRISNILEKSFKEYNKNKPLEKRKFKEILKFKSKEFYKKDLNQAHILILLKIRGLKAISYKERYTWNLISTILTSGISSRLFKKIREELGLAYYVRSGIDFYTDRGYLYVQTGVNLDNIEIALKKIGEELKNLKIEKIEKEELEKGKAILKNNLLSFLESSLNICYFLGLEYILTNKIILPKEIISEIDKITEEDIRKIMSKYLERNRLVCGILLPDSMKSKKFDKIFYNFI